MKIREKCFNSLEELNEWVNTHLDHAAQVISIQEGLLQMTLYYSDGVETNKYKAAELKKKTVQNKL